MCDKVVKEKNYSNFDNSIRSTADDEFNITE